MSTIQRWGNALGLRIPAKLAGQLQISEGTEVRVSIEDDALVVRPMQQPKYSLKELLKDCRPHQLHGEDDLGDEVGREIVE